MGYIIARNGGCGQNAREPHAGELWKIFGRYSVTLSAKAMQAAPVGLGVTVTATAVKGTLNSATIKTRVTGTMKATTWLKLKFASGVGAAALLAGGFVTVVVSNTAAIPSDGHTGVTAFSLLEKTPTLANAVCEKELFIFKSAPPETH